MKKIPVTAVEEAARRYASAGDAAKALGISKVVFRRLCNQYEITWRKGKQWADGSSKKYNDKCATQGCDRHPSAHGLCFRCYAEMRRNERV